jgi:NAD+ synthase (glutamine-hydrolysing)
MANVLKLAFAQLNLLVGDVGGNAERIIRAIGEARASGADMVVLPELALSGYPPEDLLFHAGLRRQVESALARVTQATAGIVAVVGYPEFRDSAIYNSAAWLEDGQHRATYRKSRLPNYSVFDEQRYFTPGTAPVVIDYHGTRVALGICEDVWDPGPCRAARDAGAQLIVVPNGSPFEIGKQQQREAVLSARARETGIPIAYGNLVGAQDELVFDGGSCLVDSSGEVVARAPAFEEGLSYASLHLDGPVPRPLPASLAPLLAPPDSVYRALVTGVRDYVGKNGFRGAVLGLSGGVDSALTLAIAVDALGAGAVQAVMMPYEFTAPMSLEDAEAQATKLGVDYQVIPIHSIVGAARGSLAALFAEHPAAAAGDTTEENLQSRSRGLLLMAISNRTGRIVLATGNKSEMAVGYATLYGDMVGGFAPIKDCTKTWVYRLARHRNSLGAAIPQRVLERPPSAELRPDQKDSDSLPPYEVLDPILDALMIENRSVDDIAAHGADRAVVARVLEMVRRAEYKRRQAAPGVRITSRAFGRDWRYPITSGYQYRG